MRSIRLVTLLVCVCGMAQAASVFDEGVIFFQKGAYAEAARAFEKAQREGNSSPQLRYNLGVTYYKLGKYKKAEENFILLQGHGGYRDLATYNLGELSLKQGDRTAAQNYYRQVQQRAADKKLQALATLRLQELRQLKTNKADGMIDVGLGSDSNVSYEPVNGAASNTSDSYSQLYVSGKLWLQGDERGGYDLRATYSSVNYSRLSAYNLASIKLEGEKNFVWNGWLSSLGLAYDKTTFGGQNYLSSLILDLQAKQSLSDKSKLYLSYRYNQHGVDNSAYAYLGGGQQQARVSYSYYPGQDSYHAYYEFEFNNRTNTSTRSYSPIRHTLMGAYYHDLSKTTMLQTELSYRSSHYPALGTSAVRNDNRVRIEAKLSYALSKSARLLGAYSYTTNTSTDTLYRYNRSVITLSGRYYF